MKHITLQLFSLIFSLFALVFSVSSTIKCNPQPHPMVDNNTFPVVFFEGSAQYLPKDSGEVDGREGYMGSMEKKWGVDIVWKDIYNPKTTQPASQPNFPLAEGKKMTIDKTYSAFPYDFTVITNEGATLSFKTWEDGSYTVQGYGAKLHNEKYFEQLKNLRRYVIHSFKPLRYETLNDMEIQLMHEAGFATIRPFSAGNSLKKS